MKFDEKIQLIIVGESSVGKTSLLYKYSIFYLDTPKESLQTNIWQQSVG
jgi:GTPase SAR1 family protein